LSEAPTVPEVEEVRVAMALNGGVSLAVWMGGCAVELDCARRAHGGAEQIDGAPARTIYHAICEAFSRRLVVDVMSGSSAGGINGALLAAAVVHRRRLHPDYLRMRWIELGDLGALLRPLKEVDPYSLMDGGYFFTKLQETFRDVCWEDRSQPDPEPRNEPEHEPLALDPPPGLDVTTTDVAGADRRYADVWGGELTALEYRARFRFRANRDYTAENLAVAARSSASFPLAFEPFVVEHDDAKRLAQFGDGPPRLVIDGGLLDNAPIEAAIALIKSRPARGYVTRYLCYVNGEPKDVTEPERPSRKRGTPEEAERLRRNPHLPKVLANVLGLPRKAPFADQLRALDDAAWRGEPTNAAELALLDVDAATLDATAAKLLEVYRERRHRLSLRELLEPADAAASAGEELPWIPPETFGAPPEGEWGWGVQSARRVHHLMADLIRAAIAADDTRASHPALMRARATVDIQIANAELRRVARDRSADLDAAMAAAREDDAAVREDVRATAEAVFAVRREIDRQDAGIAIAAALFGPGWEGDAFTPAMFEVFLRRVLAIEVVRRAFSMERDVDDGQRLGFAQLTPFAPTPLLDAEPLADTGPERSPETKLTGIRLAHFSAFHRRSWRANDFMWGRLDGAARVVDMLIDAGRACDVAVLAEALTPEGDDPIASAQRALVEEALADRSDPRPGVPASGDLRARVAAAIAYDLGGRPAAEAERRGRLTTVLCSRAAQLEVLAHELPTLVATAADDSASGASTPPLDLPAEDPLAAVRALREQPPLPKQLGRDELAEAVSDLALRTVSRGGLVTLALLRGSTVPFMSPTQVLRAPLLSIAGMVARNRLVYRPLVTLVFAASALLLAARAAAVTPASSDLEGISKDAFVLAIICALTVLGVLVVPALRAFGRNSLDRVVHGAVALVALAGVFVAGVLAGARGPRSIADALIAADFDVPWWVLAGPLALVLYSLPAGLRYVRWLKREVQRPWSPMVGPALAVLSSGAVGYWSLTHLDGLPWWGLASLIVSVAVVGVYAFAQRRLIGAARRVAPRGRT
jgi:predicted acylesterase/phospholipase RssA